MEGNALFWMQFWEFRTSNPIRNEFKEATIKRFQLALALNS